MAPDETTPDGDASVATEPAPAALSDASAALLAKLAAEIGDDAVLESGEAGTELVVRIAASAWAAAAAACHARLGFDYLCFIAGIDWMPMPVAGDDAGGDTSSPVQPTDTTYGVAGSAGRFQVIARVGSTRVARSGLTLKVDTDESDPRAQSWCATYPGADWHERECWEMYGIVFDGHPSLRHLYLPSGFEGHPLRKDFPLLAREVKPWPGLVNVEAMPGEDGDDDEGGAA